jgi:hypothetical protein
MYLLLACYMRHVALAGLTNSQRCLYHCLILCFTPAPTFHPSMFPCTEHHGAIMVATTS